MDNLVLPNVFTFRDSTYTPPSDYVIREVEDISEIGINEVEAQALFLLTIGYDHITWN